MTGILIKRGEETFAKTRRCTGKMPREMYREHGVMHLPAKEGQGLLATPEAERKAWDTYSLRSQREHSPANTLIWDF